MASQSLKVKRCSLKTGLSGLFALALVAIFAPGASADGDFEVKTGQGESFSIQHNLFGGKSYSAQDRLGNKIENKKGLLGNSKVDVSLLGNEYQRDKGILGGKSTRVSTMLGDEFQTKRSWFGLGRRKTTVNLSGTTNLINQALSRRKSDLSAAGVGSGAAAVDVSADPASAGLPVDADGSIALPADSQIEQAFPAQ
jgi:hypothetical protein